VRDWRLTQADPYTLRLAADARLGATNYADDHIWQLELAGAEPPAITVRTTYGLRARDMRLFFGFAEDAQQVVDPTAFAVPPAVRAFYVNYVRVAFQPLAGLEVVADYWVPDSHTLAGQLTVTNRSAEPRSVSLQLSAILKPIDNPQPMAPAQLDIFGSAGLLEGRTGNLDVLVLLEGPAQTATTPYPTLLRPLELAPGEVVVVRWVQAASPTPTERPPAPVRGEAPPIDHREAGLEHIRELMLREEWEGELARIELLNAGLLDIETGNPDWDAALALAQTVALRSYVGPTEHLPHPSFVFSRHIERGYSVKGDGSDYTWLWNGQVATEAYVNLPQVVAAAPELAKGVIRNWLAVQAEDGFIDWKPGLAGQRERILSIPLLAAMAWRIYEHTEDVDFLAEVYPGLRRFLDVWFTPKHDRDEDGVPEWTHTIQSAFDDNPSFVRWQAWGQAADISAAEAPDLAAYLYRECCSLQRIAAQAGLPADPVLAARAEVLSQRVAAMWRDDTASYHYVDRDSHASPAGEVLAVGRGELALDVVRRFSPPARLLVKAVGPREPRPKMEVTFYGRGRRGRHRVESLRQSRLQWFFGIGSGASDKLYSTLERVEVRGLDDQYEVTVSTVDYTRQDQTLLLPLWAGLPDAARAAALVRRTLLDPLRYWRPYGLPNVSALDPAYKPDNRGGSGGVWLMWNTMLGEGLLDYGFRAEAAELVTRLMTAMLAVLREQKSFREAYNADELEGLGDRDYLWGVAPVALLMRVLGVRLVGSRKVYLEGRNPFPWPVTVRHKALTVVRGLASDAGAAATTVTFPSGRSAVVTGEAPQVVEDVA
jgi:hypothetical protein